MKLFKLKEFNNKNKKCSSWINNKKNKRKKGFKKQQKECIISKKLLNKDNQIWRTLKNFIDNIKIANLSLKKCVNNMTRIWN